MVWGYLRALELGPGAVAAVEGWPPLGPAFRSAAFIAATGGGGASALMGPPLPSFSFGAASSGRSAQQQQQQRGYADYHPFMPFAMYPVLQIGSALSGHSAQSEK